LNVDKMPKSKLPNIQSCVCLSRGRKAPLH
jgi:hypothetical protein